MGHGSDLSDKREKTCPTDSFKKSCGRGGALLSLDEVGLAAEAGDEIALLVEEASTFVLGDAGNGGEVDVVVELV